MLVYQEDYFDLKQKLHHYKLRNLEESVFTDFIPAISLSNSDKTLDRAFVFDEEEITQNELLNTDKHKIHRGLHEIVDKQTIDSALHVVSNKQ